MSAGVNVWVLECVGAVCDSDSECGKVRLLTVNGKNSLGTSH